MTTSPSIERGAEQLLEHNRRFYDALWSNSRLVRPQRFNTWPRICELARESSSRLEVGAGMRPRLPLEGGCFSDISAPAMKHLQAAGGQAVRAQLQCLPFADGAFDLVAALDILEHVNDDVQALGELRRVLRPGGRLLLSFPLHRANWTPFDELVGHYRRYDPARLRSLLRDHGIRILESAVYGMKPKSSRLVAFGMRILAEMPERAMWWYNNVFVPIGMRLQKPLLFEPRLIDEPEVEGIIVVAERV
jgi:SAM-dependent methyltransferase